MYSSQDTVCITQCFRFGTISCLNHWSFFSTNAGSTGLLAIKRGSKWYFIVRDMKSAARTTVHRAMAVSESTTMELSTFSLISVYPKLAACISPHQGCACVQNAYKAVARGAHHRSTVVQPLARSSEGVPSENPAGWNMSIRLTMKKPVFAVISDARQSVQGEFATRGLG